jgi:phosphoribosyl 1,2-cyclic phosphodiesterase
MIDCGADWRRLLARIRPAAVLVTHAHPDHARGLAGGAPCPVYATAESWRIMERYPIADRRVIRPGRSFVVGGLTCGAFPLEHSLRAPAVGFRVATRQAVFFYVSDVASILDRARALRGVDLYIGDGASLTRPILRRRDGVLIGHAAIREQLAWCGQEGIGRAIFTHCGSQIVAGDGRALAARVRRLGQERHVVATIACDGLTVGLPLSSGA